MHLPYLREQLEEVEGEVRRLIRGYEGMRRLGWAGLGAVVRRLCYHSVAEVQKEENMCPRYVWHPRGRLAAGRKERMWRALQAVLPGGEHMLATNRTCGRRGLILVLDTDFGAAAHGTVRWIRKEGVSMEVLHVRRKDMKEYKRAGLHHAEFSRDARMVELGVYMWMTRRTRGQEDRARWSRRIRKMWNEWVTLSGIKKRKPRCRRGGGAQQEGVVPDRGERDKARPGILFCALLGLKRPIKKVPTRTGPCCAPSTITRHSHGLAPHQGLHFHKKIENNFFRQTLAIPKHNPNPNPHCGLPFNTPVETRRWACTRIAPKRKP